MKLISAKITELNLLAVNSILLNYIQKFYLGSYRFPYFENVIKINLEKISRYFDNIRSVFP